MNTYQKQLRAALPPEARRAMARLRSPQRVQDFLDTFKIRFTAGGTIVHTPAAVLARKEASCVEGALVAAASLAYWGRPPLIMDLRAEPFDYDHVVALFQVRGWWGAVSKTNHPVLRWRDPVYASPRELAMSYFNEYFWPDRGRRYRRKTMRDYSAPFDLGRFAPARWAAGEGDLDWLAAALDESRHYPAVPRGLRGALRKAAPIEARAMRLAEWRKQRR